MVNFHLGMKTEFCVLNGSVLKSKPFRDLSTCLNVEIVRYIKIPTTEATESNDLNMEN